MRQLVYAMQFRGRVMPEARRPRVVRTTAFAPSCTVTTLVGPTGVWSAVEPAAGERATFESEVADDAAGRARGMATISFGTSVDRLHLTLLGRLDLDDDPPAAARSSLIWKVARGEGQFAGASGLITSNLVVRDREEVTDRQLGVIVLASRGGPGGFDPSTEE